MADPLHPTPADAAVVYAEARHNGSYAYDDDPGLAAFLDRCHEEARPPTQDHEPTTGRTPGQLRAALCLHPYHGSPGLLQHVTGLFHPGQVIWLYLCYPKAEVPTDEVKAKVSAECIAALARRRLRSHPEPPAVYVHIEAVHDATASLLQFLHTQRISLVVLGRRPARTKTAAVAEAPFGTTQPALPEPADWQRHAADVLCRFTAAGAAALLAWGGSLRADVLRTAPATCAVMQVNAPRPQRRLSRILVRIAGQDTDDELLHAATQLVQRRDFVVVYYPHEAPPAPEPAAKVAEEDAAEEMEDRRPLRPPVDGSVPPGGAAPLAVATRWQRELVEAMGLHEEQVAVCVEPKEASPADLGAVAAAFHCDTVLVPRGPQALALALSNQHLVVVLVP
eukprot:EG_transcript_11186